MRSLRRIRKSAKRWGRYLGVRLGLRPALADRGYAICATPRSGSTYFGQLLASTGQLGSPLEYFHTAARRQNTDPNYPQHARAQAGIVRSMGATPNGIYAVKMMLPHYFRARKRLDLFRALPNLKFIRIRRHDLLGQAISLSRALQTGQFLASHHARRKAIYDIQRIKKCIDDVQAMEAGWDQLMPELRPITFYYEDVVRDPQAAVDRVAALMDLAAPPPITASLVKITVQRDRESEEWRQRFLADTGSAFQHLADDRRTLA